MSKHTPEPWWTNGYEIGDIPMMNTKISNSIGGRSYEESIANAHRIVDCVNACAGEEDPMKFAEKARAAERWNQEFVKHGKELEQKYKQLKSQRDELLAAFEDALENWKGEILAEYEGTGLEERKLEPTLELQALLAKYKAKGGQP